MSSRRRQSQRLRDSPDSAARSRAASNDEESSSRRSAGAISDSSEEVFEHQGFATIGLKEFFDVDPRPTFVILQDANLDDGLEPVFCNVSLRSNHQLMKALSIKTKSNAPQHSPKVSSTDFRAWLKGLYPLGNFEMLNAKSFSFLGFLWTQVLVHQRYLVVSGSGGSYKDVKGIYSSLPLRTKSPGSFALQESAIQRKNQNPLPGDDNGASDPDSPVAIGTHSLSMSDVTPDWTLPQPESDLSPHIIFARSVDWSSTPLGDMSVWTPEFRQVACLLMANPHPAAVFWGEELTVIYNKAYADGVAGQKHPQLMGTGFRGPFAEIWSSVGPIFEECRRTGQSVAVADQMLPINRRGFEEEAYFTWSLTPLYGGTSNLLGLYNAPFETTRQTITDRRTRTLLKLGESVALATSVSEFWVQILKSIEDNEFDFPFALLYSIFDDSEVDETGSISSESSQSMKSCVLEGTLGVPDGHPSAPTRLDLKRARGGFIPSFREAMTTREPKILNIQDGTLSEALMEGFHWRGFGERCKLAVVCPIRPTTGENVLGFLVVGINPRRPYDDDYQSFISLLNRQLATSLASVTLFEEQIHRGHSTEVERSRLSEELAVQRSRLQRIAEVSPVGMFSISTDGLVLEANDRWYEMTGHQREFIYEVSWMEAFMDSSAPEAEAGWKRMFVEGKPWSGELQLKKPSHHPVTGEEVENWILGAGQPEFDQDGTVKSVMGSITDITLQKRSAKDADTRARLSEQLLLRTQEAEALQKQRLNEAEETRRQQNNFIDITSHEMRNPLSAIVQCADSIATSLKEYTAANPDLEPALVSVVKANIESAETIQLCAGHQKSIVDDILTISKLDSNLLLITPVPIQPMNIMEQCLRMFKTEVQTNDIKMEIHIDNSIQQLKVDRVMLDPSRLLQILINLMTNAIKFTKSEKKRAIDVSLSAYVEPPTEGILNFQYFPTNKVRSDFTSREDWGSGEILYLRWEVRDTGCGLTENEKKNLFTRFSQASPRTHVQYGGSGLGLFISRQLAELQGGEIGVASDAGVGSTFAFYLKSRRAEGEVSEATEMRVRADLQSSAHLTTDDTNDLRDQEESLSKLPQYSGESLGFDVSSPTRPSAKTEPSDWHILIVEDNLVNQRVLAQQIRKLGCTVHVANHGQEALDLLQETKYYEGRESDGKELSVILMDLEMPVMDGLTCVRKIREMEAEGLVLKRLPIIAVTANTRGEQIATAKDSGMDDVIPKPFRIKQLVPKIEALLHKTS